MVKVVKQVYRPVSPSVDAAAKGSISDRINWMNSLHNRVQALEQKLGAQGSSSDSQSPVASVPPRGRLAVTFASGFFTVQITNPEDAGRKNGLRDNPRRTPIKHLLESSLTAGFDGAGDVRSFGPSVQTHWSIQLTGSRWWKLTSTYDGDNYSPAILHGPVGA